MRRPAARAPAGDPERSTGSSADCSIGCGGPRAFDDSLKERPLVVFLVNGGRESALAHRARSFAERLCPAYRLRLLYRGERKLWATVRFLWALMWMRPQIVYVLDMAASGVLAALVYRWVTRRPVIVDTGDVISALARSMGRGRIGLGLTRLLERVAVRAADWVVVRGRGHREWLHARGITRVEVIPDGVEMGLFFPRSVETRRRELGMDGKLVVGVVGSLQWSRTLGLCYGWELIEALAHLRDQPVVGVIVGEGSGRRHLEERARALGLQDRVRFFGSVPFAELPEVISLMDVCLSTQTNDLVGQVRTTGKLPLYLACGRFVLASRVGEAARILPEEMVLPYEGQKDERYPRAVADRLRWLLAHPDRLRCEEESRALARVHFDYDLLVVRLRAVLDRALERS